MSSRKKITIFSLILVAAFFDLTGCGVKGDPLPPERPVEIGRGRPTYRRATEGLKIETPKKQDQKDDQQ